MRATSKALAVGVVVLGLVACGGDGDDASPTSAVVGSDTTTGEAGNGGLEIAGSVDDDDLVVPRDYLQGEWCNTDGQTLTIEGDTIRLEDGSGGVGEMPIDLVFVDGPGVELVSQTDDEFVIRSEGYEVTFSRGSC